MILISAGHHPDKPGACFEDFCEHEEAIIWAMLIHKELVMAGVENMLVPTGRLSEKTKFINNSDASLAIEIHFNSDPWHVGKGCETLRYPKSTKGALAGSIIQLAMASVIGKDRGVLDGYYQLDPKKGVNWFLKATKCTALIIEPEFIHNRDNIQANRERCCEEIAKALFTFQAL